MKKTKTVLFVSAFIFLLGVSLPASAGSKSIGHLDGVDQGTGKVWGWALDPDAPTKSIAVHFYANGPAGSGLLIGSATANIARPDVNKVTKYPGNHGFSWQLPDRYKIGYHQIYAYAIDTNGDGNPVLVGAPKTIGARPSANSSISVPFNGSNITITTTERLAGAIGSLKWNGQEFINSYDHGRELQSASSYDGLGECFNPTEAGSSPDGTGLVSTSVLRKLTKTSNSLQASTQMAFWLKALSPYGWNCGHTNFTTAQNKTNLSNHYLDKTVTIGFAGIPNVIEHKISFFVPEAHKSAVWETLTGYMPPTFSSFYSYNPSTKTLAPLSDGRGEQNLPVILSTPDKKYAMGVYSPDLPEASFPSAGYGRFKFADTVKWNCVFRGGNVIAGSTHNFRCYSIVGTLTDVTNSIDKLHTYFNPATTLDKSSPDKGRAHGRNK
ncbi:MAG TPA: hypothetical protein VJB98_01550 [Candidatus Paceibacterota bacterium]